VSVFVPNYNYARYLEGRLGTIFSQQHPIHEILVLDDASTDESVRYIEDIFERNRRDFVLAENKKNAGNIFSQWLWAAEQCEGDLIWIAEADDLSSPNFLASLAPFFDDDALTFAFCDSTKIDANGTIIQDSYKPYYEIIGAEALTRNLSMKGIDFLLNFLLIKNVVMNVSSVLWRRRDLITALRSAHTELEEYRLAGDWRIYIEACLGGGNVAYTSEVLNAHRRHEGSVTGTTQHSRHLQEIRAIHTMLCRRLGDFAREDMAHYRRELALHFGLNVL